MYSIYTYIYIYIYKYEKFMWITNNFIDSLFILIYIYIYIYIYMYIHIEAVYGPIIKLLLTNKPGVHARTYTHAHTRARAHTHKCDLDMRKMRFFSISVTD